MQFKTYTSRILAALLTMLLASPVMAADKDDNDTNPSPTIEKDKGLYVKNGQVKSLYKAMEPHIRHARATYPFAKKRWRKGLPKGHYFFVVARLRDAEGTEEQVFISVATIRNGFIKGYIYNKHRQYP